MSDMVPMYGFGGGGSGGKTVTVHVTPGTGANVTCTNGKKTFTVTTDENGDAIFKLAKGTWTITAEKSGVSVLQNVTVAEDCTVNIDLNQIPAFTYTGTYKIVDDNDNDNAITSTIGNWKIRFLTSGTLKFTDLKGAANGIDVFLVGGGGHGVRNSESIGGAGGGGGYTRTIRNVTLSTNATYTITVGGSAGNTSAFGYTAGAGKTSDSGYRGGDGGSGGAVFDKSPGSDGGDGGVYSSSSNWRGGYGQKSVAGPNGETGTTREFGESGKTVYSTGGYGQSTASGAANTGNGGGGHKSGSGSGGSGIVIIRNKR